MKPHNGHVPSCLCRCLIGAGLLSISLNASALSLGDISYRGRMGEALRLEIPLKGSASDPIESSCISLVPQPQNDTSDVPWLTQAKLEIRQTDKGQVLSISARPSKSPALMLGVMIKCGGSLRRDYTLLLDPPSASEPRLALEPVASSSGRNDSPAKHGSRAKTSQTWVVGSGESLDSVSKTLYPKDSSARKRFVRKAQDSLKLQSTSEQLPPGTELPLPSAAAIAPQARDTSGNRAAPATEAQPPKPQVQAGSKRDRILVSEAGEAALQLATTIGQSPEVSEQERAKLRNELQLIAVLDEKNAQHLEIKERLRQIEEIQARLKAEAAQVESELKNFQSGPNENQLSQSGASPGAPLEVKAKTPMSNASVPAEADSKWRKAIVVPLLLLVLAAGLIALILQQRKRKKAQALTEPSIQEASAAHVETTEATLESSLENAIDEDLMMAPLSQSDIWPETTSSDPSAKLMEGTIGPLAQPSSSGITVMHTETGEEHDSAVELAEIMMSFGRVQGAAQTLSDFIRANPRQAVKPWIKLLEVYRAADMKMEFDALSVQLNKTFNVKTVPWDEFEVALRAPESIEDMGHLIQRICELWGQQDCQAFLHELLRDNRQGTRQGFPLVVIDEILLLLSILEDRLGHYHPEAPANEDTHPATLPFVRTQDPNHQDKNLPIFAPPPDSPLFEKSLSIMAQTPLGSEPVLNPESPANESLDFDLIDIDLLTQTLHINLDELTDEPPPAAEKSAG